MGSLARTRAGSRALCASLPLWAGAVLCAAASPPDQPVSRRPNILFILLDDLDYSDLGVYVPSEILTENIDRLASQGMRFTQFYGNPICTPARAAILSGGYHTRFNMGQRIQRDSFRGLPPDVPTLGELLRARGYRTGFVGKWDVGDNRPEFLPTRRGFDYAVRKLDGGGYYNYELSFNDGPPQQFWFGEHLTRALTDYALEFLAAADPEQPFFLCLWHFAPHAPLEPPLNFDNSRTNYDLLSLRGRFAALVTDADRQIARLLEQLEAWGLAERTLVIVAGDNGGADQVHSGIPRPLRGFKKDVFEGGIRVPLIVRWPHIVPAGAVNDSVVLSFDLLPTLAELCGAAPPAGLDGRSFWSVLRSGAYAPREELLFWENKADSAYFPSPEGAFNTWAVRSGDWKLVYHQQQRMLFDLATDMGESTDRSAEHPQFVGELEQSYRAWRRTTGDVPCEPELSDGAVRAGDVLAFSGGAARIGPDTRLDFHDGDFGFATWIRPEQLAGEQVIATKPGSWRLALSDETVALTVNSADGATLVLDAPLPSNQPQTHVAFTLFGWPQGDATVRLYVDGELAAASTNRVVAVNPNLELVYLGNAPDGSAPFVGQMSVPRLALLSWYASEVREDYVSSLCAGDANTDWRVDLADLSLVLTNFGLGGGLSRSDGDLNADDRIDIQDLLICLTHFGSDCPAE